MSDELKPCPFCGTRLIKNGPFSRRNADCFVHVQYYQGRDYGRCPSAGFRLFSDDAERIALWNTRAQGPGPGEAVADDPARYRQRIASDFATAVTRDLADDFPNYADWSVTLPAGHWRDLLKMIAATPTREGALDHE